MKKEADARSMTSAPKIIAPGVCGQMPLFLQPLVNETLYLVLGDRPDDLVHDLPVFKKYKRGNASDPVLARG